jgi:hypothetical protein
LICRDLRLDVARRLLADHLGEGAPENALRIGAEGLRVLPVRELAAKVARAVIGDQHRHVVGEQAHQCELGLHVVLLDALRGDVANQTDPRRRGRPALRGELEAAGSSGRAMHLELDSQRVGGPSLQGVEQALASRAGQELLPALAEQFGAGATGELDKGLVGSQRAAVGAEQQQHAGHRVPQGRVGGAGLVGWSHRAGGRARGAPEVRRA